MSKRIIFYLSALILITSCLDREESNYQLNYETYKVEGIYLKNCEGDPVLETTLRLYSVSSLEGAKKILAESTTDEDGSFSINYSLETTTFRSYINSLFIYRYDENLGVEQLISSNLSWQKDLFVELIDQLVDTISISTSGLNQLSNLDTLFVNEVSDSDYEKYFIGPFPDGRNLDLIVRAFQSYYPFEMEWYISDTCFYGNRNVNCNPGNYGFVREVVPYCNRLRVSIDLSNTVK